MSMTRPDFKAIAEIIRKYNNLGMFDDLAFYKFVEELTLYFRKVNPTFDRGKFMKACGYYQE